MASKAKTTSAKSKPRAVRAKAARPVFDVDNASVKRINARYDVSRSTDENANLWKYVDSLSAAEANSPSVRKTIRNRARYEVANNSYAYGIVETLAADTIGPEIQLQLGDTDLSQRTECAFSSWAMAVNLWAKLRTMRRAKVVDGEAFGLFVTNRKVVNPVKLDLRLMECDRIESWIGMQNDKEIDGIRFDDEGNPVEYRVLNTHPGDYRRFMKSLKGDWTKAEYVLHYFREIRPGQVRGVSELVPALSLFGELRLFTKAVINAAARAAEISGVMQTDMLPDNVAAELADPLTMIEIARNNLISLPEGWKLAQLKAEQPATTYAMFKKEIINEAARCLSMPTNIAMCDSSGYNYASGRLDHQTYERGIEVERAEITHDVLNRVYAAWLAEYRITAALSASQMIELQDHEWHFAGRGHVDPNKEANADETRLKNGTLTRARYWAKHGADHKRETLQWIKERIDAETEWNKARSDAGLVPAPFIDSNSQFAPVTVDESEEDDKPKETE